MDMLLRRDLGNLGLDSEGDRVRQLPGKSTLTSRLAPATQLTVLRLSDPAVARALGEGIAGRDANGVAAGADAAVERAAASTGTPLPTTLQRQFERSLDADLSRVRLHTGAASREAADAVGARAYTVGQDIHFADGMYQPDDPFGLHLLAHEVAHTVQQDGAAPVRQHQLVVSTPQDAAEHEADRAADAMVRGEPTTVSRSAGVGRVVAREPAPAAAPKPEGAKPEGAKPPGEARALTAEDKGRLANAQQLLDKAKANIDKATSALQSYTASAPGLLATIKSDFDATLTTYKTQFDRVNSVIAKGQRIYKLQMTALNLVLDEISGHLASQVYKAMTSTTEFLETYQIAEGALTSAMSGASALDALAAVKGDASKASGGITDQAEAAVTGGAKKGAGMATEGTGPGDASGGMELTFYKNYAALQGKANQLLPLAVGAAKLGAPFGEASTLVRVMQQDAKTRPDKTPQAVETDAANVWNGSAGIGAAASGVDTCLAELRATASQGAATKPKGNDEIERELWVKWAASLPSDNTDMLDLDYIEDYLRAKGIWDQLGIKIGGWMSDKDEALAVCSAKAQELVLQHKGEVVEVTNDHGGARVTLAELGELPATFESRPTAKRVRATVIGATTAGPLEEGVLAPRDRNIIARNLIKAGKVQVVLRAFEDLVPGEEALPSGP
ncbi:MAG: DUF4157 domain-containing protein [Kofleriaceae bacterium]|nr:DUF4157 domain-containing protein [Kofleriaceae bacterium]